MNINASIKKKSKFSKKGHIILTLKLVKLKYILLLKLLTHHWKVYINQHNMYESKRVQSDESKTKNFPSFQVLNIMLE